jgi:acetylornithine deacetylase/succinyl-diaminopimelate desuccinylase-like protein
MTGRRLTTILAATAGLLSIPAHAADPLTDVARYRAAHEKAIVGQLDALARVESVAANPQALVAQADMLAGLLEARGFTTRKLAADGSPPIVLGELRTPGAKRTVIFYAHYDGQPVTPSQWATPPFAPMMRGGTLQAKAPPVDWQAAAALDPEWRLYGRAVSDDKASIAAFLAAYDALKATGHKPKINIKVVWEGEEERGSPHLEAILAANKALFASDLWLIGDGPVHQSRKPTLYFGARGTMGLELGVYGPLRALHDGHYGNWVPNPAMMAAELVTSLRAPDGSIRIPGFADDVRPLNPTEQAAIAALPPVEAGLAQEFGIGAPETKDGLTAATMRPSINIRGIAAGQVGEAAANAIPVDARVSIDFRLVPGQTPERVRAKVEAYLAAQGWTLVDAVPDLATRLSHPRIVRVQWEGGYRALRTDMTTPVARAVVKAAGDGIAVLPMMGGSVPITLFDEIFHVPVIGLPIANHDNSQHAANENLRLQNLWDGVALYAAMMTRLDW